MPRSPEWNRNSSLHEVRHDASPAGPPALRISRRADRRRFRPPTAFLGRREPRPGRESKGLSGARVLRSRAPAARHRRSLGHGPDRGRDLRLARVRGRAARELRPQCLEGPLVGPRGPGQSLERDGLLCHGLPSSRRLEGQVDRTPPGDRVPLQGHCPPRSPRPRRRPGVRGLPPSRIRAERAGGPGHDLHLRTRPLRAPLERGQGRDERSRSRLDGL